MKYTPWQSHLRQQFARAIKAKRRRFGGRKSYSTFAQFHACTVHAAMEAEKIDWNIVRRLGAFK